MNQPRYLQMVRTNRFELIYQRWKKRKFTQAEAGEQFEMSERTFRRYVVRYEEKGKQGLGDRRLGKPSPRRASQQEVSRVVALCTGTTLPESQHKAFLRGLRRGSQGHSRLQLGKEMSAGCGVSSQGPPPWAALGA